MKVHVFDTYVTIKDREGHPDMDDTLLEKLDEMLTTYGVPHAFSLPHEKTMEDCPEAALEVAYDSSDDIQALLRAQMISDFNKYSEKGYAPIYARDNFENCWKQYHSLGVNGVMDDLHRKFLELPTDPPEE